VGLLDGKFEDGHEVGFKADEVSIGGMDDGTDEGSSLSFSNSNSFSNLK
jgi:hypothetical protein